jgi:integrase
MIRPDMNLYLRKLADRGRRRAFGPMSNRKTRVEEGTELSYDTLRLHRAALSVLFETAIDDGVIEHNPARNATLPATDAPEPRRDKALTADELRRLLAALPEYWLPFFLVMAFTGLRIAEVLGLRWRDIAIFGREIAVETRRYRIRGTVWDDPVNEDEPKSRYGIRTVGFPSLLAKTLAAKRTASRFSADDDYFYCNGHGRPHSYTGAYKALKKAARAAGLDWVSPRTLRHTNASILYNELGWTDKQVQVHHGHHSASFTADTYIHLRPEQLPSVEALDSIIDLAKEATG